MPSDASHLGNGELRPLYADVIVPRHIAKAFTYIVPPALAQTISIGQKVLVPFGRTILEGAVIALTTRAPREMATARLKEIRSLVDNPHGAGPASARLELSRTIAEHYVAPWGQCLRLLQSRHSRRQPSQRRYIATHQGQTARTSGTCPEHLRGMLDRIARRSRGILESTLLQSRDRDSRHTFEALEQRSWIAAVPLPDAKTDVSAHTSHPIGDGTDHQEDAFGHGRVTIEPQTTDPLWVDRITDCLKGNRPHKIVLHAPWEHRVGRLIDTIRQTHRVGKSAIVLVGEIAKVDWLGRLLSDLIDSPMTVLSPSWASHHRASVQHGSPSVIVGTRSTVFTPCESVGLIWVEGEDDPAFKEPQEPRYHARDVAWMRAQTDGALLVLASSHPSLESFFDPHADIHTVHVEPARRPAIELVDLRHEPGGTLLSRHLIEAMQRTMENKTGIVLFKNRKGYAHTLICRDCGWIPRCPTCAVSLGYSREAAKLACRYCGKGDRVPESCPLCHASHLRSVGDGTERVETEVRRVFPLAHILRLDGEKLRRSSTARDVWEEIRSGAWDILIGTQALFQREPLPRRKLVGILQADSGLHIPDFRAAERTYQQMDDAVSVALPESEGGRVIVQTHLPTHHAVQAVLSNDPQRFYTEELEARRLLHYPPICHVATLSISGKDAQEVATAAAQWKHHLDQSVREENPLTLLGPVPTPGRSTQGRYRQQLLAKGADRAFLCARLRESVERLEHQYRKQRITFVVDMDPVDMR